MCRAGGEIRRKAARNLIEEINMAAA